MPQCVQFDSLIICVAASSIPTKVCSTCILFFNVHFRNSPLKRTFIPYLLEGLTYKAKVNTLMRIFFLLLAFLSTSKLLLGAQLSPRTIIFENFACHVEDGKHNACWSLDANIGVERIRIQRAASDMVFETVEELVPHPMNTTYLVELPPTTCQDYYYRLEAEVRGEVIYSNVDLVACQAAEGAQAFELRSNIDAQRVILVKNALEATNNAHYRIYNLQGNFVAQRVLPAVFQQEEVDISGLPTGNYLLRVYHGMEASSPLRFIKVN